jgi:hypothetical protein
MPYRPATTRVAKYDAMVIPANVQAKFTAWKSQMTAQQQTQQTVIEGIENSIRGLLDTASITGTGRVPYLNFGRALLRAKGHQSGAALKLIAAAEYAKVLAYGLDDAICKNIATAVIGSLPYGVT